MREIKFNAWDKKTKTMHLWAASDVSLDFEGLIYYCGNFHPDFQDRFIVLQFTGLKDKNGRRIFDGDIVKVKIMKSDGHLKNWKDWLKFKGEVVFSNTGFAIKDKSKVIWQFSGGGLLWAIMDIEVIGNKFENPELLEEEK